MDPYRYRPSSAFNTPFLTNNQGGPVYNNTSSLTIGNRGPVLLEDYHLVEKIANFHRERIPERIVHARGASAKGYFEVTHDITHLTCADFLRGVGVQVMISAAGQALKLSLALNIAALWELPLIVFQVYGSRLMRT
jgi:catalase